MKTVSPRREAGKPGFDQYLVAALLEADGALGAVSRGGLEDRNCGLAVRGQRSAGSEGNACQDGNGSFHRISSAQRDAGHDCPRELDDVPDDKRCALGLPTRTQQRTEFGAKVNGVE